MRTIAAAAVTFALLCTASASSRTLPIRSEATIAKTVSVKQSVKSTNAQAVAQLHRAARQVGEIRRVTWACQDKLGVTRTHASTDVWSLPPSVGYRVWVSKKWVKLAKDCQTALNERSIPATNDWLTAVKLVQRIYPGTSDWLLFISHREGGWGGFVMNHQGSGAGGQMQFLASTYYAYSNAAFADARSRGFILPSVENSWYRPLGQAITAGYMRYTHRDGCHWCL